MNSALQTQRRLFILLLLALFVLILFIFRPFLMSLTLGTLFAVLFYPLYQWFLKLFRNYRYVASFFSTLIVVLFIFVPISLVGSLVASQLSGIVEHQVIPFIERGELIDLLQKWNVNIKSHMAQIEEAFSIQINLKALTATAIKKGAQIVSQYSPNVLAQTIGFAIQSFITLIVVFFLFVEGKGLFLELIRISPLKESHEVTLATEMKNMIYSVIYGSFVTAIVQGILAGVGFYFLGIRGYLVWGTLTFLFSFIPILGAGSVWIPATIILFLLGETKSGIILMIYGAVIISGVDNILKPLLIGSRNKIHPLLLFLSIVGSLLLLGPVGILFGPVVIAMFMAALKIYKQDYLENSV